MYSKGDRAFKGSVGIQARGNSIQFNLPRSWFKDTSQIRFTLGLPNTADNWAEAERIGKQIERDYLLEALPETVEGIKAKYLPKSRLTIVESIKVKELSAIDLWDKFHVYEVASGKHKKSTLNQKKQGLGSPIKKLIDIPCTDALQIRAKLMEVTTNHMVKRVLMELNAACKWGIKHKLVAIALSPFEGMAQELPNYKYQDEPAPNAFSEEEREMTIQAFRDHKGNWNGRGFTGCKYSHYAPFVEFLFLTGCRPSEAVGLRWKDVSSDCGDITFNGSLQYIHNAWERIEGSKNNKKRVFPCGQRLRELLQSIRTEVSDRDSLVFPSPKGKTINYGNFSKGAWDKVVDPIKPGTTPYNARDTFITSQLMKGIGATQIGTWTDITEAMIRKHYADSMKMVSIRPID